MKLPNWKTILVAITGVIWGVISFIGMISLTYDEINWINILLYLPALGSYLILGSPVLMWFIFLWIIPSIITGVLLALLIYKLIQKIRKWRDRK